MLMPTNKISDSRRNLQTKNRIAPVLALASSAQNKVSTSQYFHTPKCRIECQILYNDEPYEGYPSPNSIIVKQLRGIK
jgi:hypothetical protein